MQISTQIVQLRPSAVTQLSTSSDRCSRWLENNPRLVHFLNIEVTMMEDNKSATDRMEQLVC